MTPEQATETVSKLTDMLLTLQQQQVILESVIYLLFTIIGGLVAIAFFGYLRRLT